MTLEELYQEEKSKPTPAQVFITRIAEATCREESTVRQWLSGTQEPNQKAKEKIADLHGRSVDELFKKPSHGKKSATDNQESNPDKKRRNRKK